MDFEIVNSIIFESAFHLWRVTAVAALEVIKISQCFQQPVQLMLALHQDRSHWGSIWGQWPPQYFCSPQILLRPEKLF